MMVKGMMDKGSMFDDSPFDKMANHVKDLHGGISGDVSTKKNELPEMIQTKPYTMPSFAFMDLNKGKKA